MLPSSENASSQHWLGTLVLGCIRIIFKLSLLLMALVLCAGLLVGIFLATAYPKLPEMSELTDYRPKLPLRIYSAEGMLLAEFGEEKRQFTRISDIPPLMKNAILAAEDARFFEHHGVDYLGIARAALSNIAGGHRQGASTISMQVARNAFLSQEKTYTRKIYEILLTFKIEHLLSKEEILEIYMNHIFLGHRAYGFAAAAQVYFGKSLADLTISEAAMLAGLPKAPSMYNPINNPPRARQRQLYIIDRMEELRFIDQSAAALAKSVPLQIRQTPVIAGLHGEYAAEIVRQTIVEQYGDDAYTRGLNVTTTIKSSDQLSAYKALRQGMLDFERRQAYRGPEKFIDLPALNDPALDDAVDDALNDHPDSDDILSAVVLQASTKQVLVMRPGGVRISITGEGLHAAQSALSDKAAAHIRLRKGAIIRIMKNAKSSWDIAQLPDIEGALVALDPRTGAIRSMVGGFDFQKNKFNHVTQAWRQPGSSFKPFIYSAAVDKGLTATTVVNDAPLFFGPAVTGGKPWEPKNYDGKFEGPMPIHNALAKSKNMVSIRVLQMVGAKSAQEWIRRFGFEAERHPAYLTMALGAGSVTPLQMASAYGVFANGGYLVSPIIIQKVTDSQGQILLETPALPPKESMRAVEARNAFVMGTLLQEITRSGTAAKAQAMLKRTDLYGKTGTTNDAMDAWFVGFQPSVVAAVWIGYDNPRNLGSRETGGGLSLPIWIRYMQDALKNVPENEMQAPDGLVKVGNYWYYEEFKPGSGIAKINSDADKEPNNTEGTTSHNNPSIEPDEKKNILDLFKN